MQNDPIQPRARRRQSGLTLMELLVAMSIASVLTGMVLLSWFSLQDSYSHTTRAGEARDIVRDAMSRMVREIRDAQGPGGGSAIVTANPWYIDVYTTFNDAGEEDSGYGRLRLTRFQYDSANHRVLRIRDTNDSGTITTADRTTVLATNVQNSSTRYLFRYWSYDAYGNPTRSGLYGFASGSTEIRNIYAVELRLVVDLNPGSPPDPVYVRSTTQLRNARPL